MQSFFQKGKSFLKIDASYLPNFTDGIGYDIVLSQRGCREIKAVASAIICGNIVQLTINLTNICLEKLGIWQVKIYEKDTQSLLHTIQVQVYPI
jgi:hypothetical protein